MSQDGPLFDSTRSALVFALNADRFEMPRPVMTRAMASTEPKLSRAAAKRKRKLDDSLTDADGQHISLTREPRARQVDLRPRMPIGLDKAAQAGFILAQMLRLDPAHVAILTGLLTRPADPCPCQRPCCSGWMPNPRFRGAVAEMCRILKDAGDVLRKPGRKGLGTHPGLREILVGCYFTKREITLLRISADVGLSSLTVAKHRAWIDGFLEQTEADAWAEADLVFSQSGIVGEL